MERIESEKNSKWRFYTLEEYRALGKQKEYTDSHNKYSIMETLLTLLKKRKQHKSSISKEKGNKEKKTTG